MFGLASLHLRLGNGSIQCELIAHRFSPEKFRSGETQAVQLGRWKVLPFSERCKACVVLAVLRVATAFVLKRVWGRCLPG